MMSLLIYVASSLSVLSLPYTILDILASHILSVLSLQYTVLDILASHNKYLERSTLRNSQ